MRSRDTSLDAHRVQLEAYRQMGPARRVRLAIEMSERAREIAIEGMLARSPGMSREEARDRVLRQILGDALFEAAAANRRHS